MAKPPKIGQTFASAKKTASNIEPPGGGFSDIRGGSGIAPPPQPRQGNSSFSNGGSGFSGQPVSRVQVTSISSRQANAPISSMKNQIEVERIRVKQRPISERLDKKLSTSEEGRNFLLRRNALNEAGLPANTTNNRAVNLAISQYLGRRGEANVSLEGGGIGFGGVGGFSQLPPVKKSVPFDSTIQFSTRPFGEKIVKEKSPVSSKNEDKLVGVRGFVFSQRIVESSGPPANIGDVLSVVPFFIPGGVFVRGLGVVSKFPVIGKAAGFVAEAPVIRNVLFRGGQVAAKVPKGLRPFAPDIIGGGLVVGGTLSTNIAQQREAEALTAPGFKNFTIEERKENIRGFTTRFFSRQLGGSEVLVDPVTGKEISKREIMPEFGDAGAVGFVQRTITPGGALFDIQLQSAEREARAFLVEKKIPATQENVQGLLNAARGTGRASVFGQFAIEAGTEVGISGGLGRTRFTRQGITTLKKGTPNEVETLFRRVLVPKQVIGGILEGGGQTFNELALTQARPNLLNVGLGGAFGGAISGGFGLLQSRALAGKFPGPGVVNVLGLAADFPGESIGDISVDVGARLLGRERPGLRVPVFGGVFTISESRVTRTQGKSSNQTSIYDLGKNGKGTSRGNALLDEFGLPNFAPTKGEGRGSGFASIFGRGQSFNLGQGFGEGNSSTDQDTKTNIGVSSEGKGQGNAFVNVTSITPSKAPFPPLFPPGRLGGDGGGGKRERLGYFDELAAVFGKTLNAPLNLKPRGRPSKSIITSRRKIGKAELKSIKNFSGYNNIFPKLKKQNLPKFRGALF